MIFGVLRCCWVYVKIRSVGMLVPGKARSLRLKPPLAHVADGHFAGVIPTVRHSPVGRNVMWL